MNVNVSNLKGKFADLKYEQLLADKYFITTCFSKSFDSRPKKEELRDIVLTLKAYALKCEGIAMIDCNLPEEFCDVNSEATTTTTSSTTTTTTTDGTTTTTTSSTTTTSTVEPTTTTTTTSSTTTTTTLGVDCQKVQFTNNSSEPSQVTYTNCDGNRINITLDPTEVRFVCADANSGYISDPDVEITTVGPC